MPDFAVRTSFTATDKLSPAFGKMGKNVNKFGRQGAKGFGMMNASASSLIGTLRMLSPAFGVLGIINLGNRAIELASDLVEVQNVVDTTFGSNSKVIDKWSKNAIKQFGLSELQAKEFTGTLGAMAASSGIAGKDLVAMSKDMVGLAGDLASFRNMSPEEAFTSLQSVVTGMPQPMRRFGVDLTIASLKAFMLSKGMKQSWKQMSQAEKILLRYKFIMEKTKLAQGDFNKTLATSYANQKRVLGVQFDQFLAQIATKFLPSLISGFTKLNSIIEYMSKNSDKFSSALSTIVNLAGLAAIAFLSYKAALMLTAFWQGAIIAIGWIKYLWMMRGAIIAAAKAQGILNLIMSLNPIGLVVLGIAALIAGFTLLVIKAGGIKNAFIVLGKSIMKFVLAPVNLLLYYIRGILKLATYLPGVGGAASSALEKLTAVQNSMNKKFEITEFDKKEAPNKDQLAAGQGQTNININNKGVETETETTGKRNVKIKGNMGKQ